MRALVHPRLMANIANHYPDSCTVQSSTPSRGSAGSVTLSWANLAGHVNAPCSVGPVSLSLPNIQEFKRENNTPVIASHHIALRGHYPAVTATMRAIVSGHTYDILAVEHDSHGMTTRLRVREVTV